MHNSTETITNIWSTVYQILGQSKNLNPTQREVNGTAVLSPLAMANEFNNIFIKKVHDLKEEIIGPVIEDPLSRLSRWPGKRQEPIPLIILKPITIIQQHKILGKLKGKRSSGIDFIEVSKATQ